MKAGTTSLWHYLRAHPRVYMPRIKELRYFQKGGALSRGLAWYEAQFAAAEPGQLAGEASPGYTKYPHQTGVPERMAAVIPDARLVYVVRDPVERIRSHYEHIVHSGLMHDPIDEAVRREPYFLDYSRYAMQADQFLEHFDREQLLIITSESLLNDRRGTLRDVYGFIGADPDWWSDDLAVEAHRTERKASGGGRGGWARRIPGRRILRRAVPPAVLEARGKWSPRPPPPPRVVIPDDLHDFIVDGVRDDVARLRTYLGPEFDGWGIA